MVRAHIIFSGTVQGVGFRFTTQRHAQRIGLTGWVRNLPDGSVELMVEGPKQQIELLCRNIEDDFQGHVRDQRVEFSSFEGAFKDFRITR